MLFIQRTWSADSSGSTLWRSRTDFKKASGFHGRRGMFTETSTKIHTSFVSTCTFFAFFTRTTQTQLQSTTPAALKSIIAVSGMGSGKRFKRSDCKICKPKRRLRAGRRTSDIWFVTQMQTQGTRCVFRCLLKPKRSYKRKGKKEKNMVKSRLNSLKELGWNGTKHLGLLVFVNILYSFILFVMLGKGKLPSFSLLVLWLILARVVLVGVSFLIKF